MKIFGIDFGTKNVGISISDDEGKVAFPRGTLRRDVETTTSIIDMIQKEQVSTVVLGMPQNVPDEWKRDIDIFKKELEEKGVVVVLQDESFSSHEAHQGAHQFGLKQVDTDQVAAAVILQRYLDKQNNS